MIYLANKVSIAAVKEAKQASKDRKFVEGIEIAINLKEVDLSDPKNRINEEISLPKGRGKKYKVAVIGTEEMQTKAKSVADYVYGPEDVSKFADDKKEFKKLANDVEYFVAEATLMANIGKSLGQVLGPRSKMPKPLPPGQDPSGLISNLKQTVRARTKDKKTFHVPVGTKEMPDEDVAENIDTVIGRLVSRTEKGYNNIESVYVKTTMGKAVRLKMEEYK